VPEKREDSINIHSLFYLWFVHWIMNGTSSYMKNLPSLLFVKSRVLMELPTCSTSFGTSCERKYDIKWLCRRRKRNVQVKEVYKGLIMRLDKTNISIKTNNWKGADNNQEYFIFGRWSAGQLDCQVESCCWWCNLIPRIVRKNEPCNLYLFSS
jgi:hypothetical protein